MGSDPTVLSSPMQVTESDYLPDLKTLWLCVCIYTHIHIHPPLWLHVCVCVRLFTRPEDSDSTHVCVYIHIHTHTHIHPPFSSKNKKNKNWYVKQEANTEIRRTRIAWKEKIHTQARSDKNKQTISNVKQILKGSSLSSTKLLDFMLSTQDTKVTALWSQGIQSLYGSPTSENKQLK